MRERDKLFVASVGVVFGMAITLLLYDTDNTIHTEYKETIAKCEADLPRNKTCTARIIAEVAE